MMPFLATGAPRFSSLKVLCREIDAVARAGVTGVTPLRGLTGPKVFALFRQLPKTASSYSGRW